MGWFGKKEANKVLDGAISGIDKLFFTNEEKTEFNKQIADAHLEYLKTTLSENSNRSITRRYMSLALMGLFIALIIAGVIMKAFDDDYASFIFEVVSKLDVLIMMVAAFFYGGYYAKGIISKSKG